MAKFTNLTLKTLITFPEHENEQDLPLYLLSADGLSKTQDKTHLQFKIKFTKEGKIK